MKIVNNIIVFGFILFASVFSVSAQISGKAVRNDRSIEIKPFEYNSSGDDLAPSITRNGTMMTFTSEGGSGQKLYILDNSNGRWQSPDEMEDVINSGKNTGSATMTSDGQYMIFASYEHDIKGYGRTDLYSSKKVNGKWQDVQNLGSAINSSSWDSQPSLSTDGTTLYFTSDRPGGQGESDIYVAKRQKDGSWSKAELVQGINTANDDMSPSIAPDNSTLYFSSNRQGSVGGFDIYTSRGKNGNFSKPINIGEPINTVSDEYFYTALPNSTTAYFASNRDGGKGGLDIYTATPNPEPPSPVVTMKGVVHDALTNKNLGANVVITDMKTRQRVADLRSDDVSGEYFVTLTAGRSYLVTATRPDYVFYSERIDVPATEQGHEVDKDIDLTPVGDLGSTRLLVFFDSDKSVLKDESLADLDRAVEFLQSNSGVKVRIEGHTDDVGDDNYNMQLSNRRAESVRAYLVEQGIDKQRISSIGFGESKPKIRGTTDEIRGQNRRVEMKIVK
jgi:outer membrane protein OmpA-like peptidoglycan-associated protein